jgi:hypothetical protein
MAGRFSLMHWSCVTVSYTKLSICDRYLTPHGGIWLNASSAASLAVSAFAVKQKIVVKSTKAKNRYRDKRSMLTM